MRLWYGREKSIKRDEIESGKLESHLPNKSPKGPLFISRGTQSALFHIHARNCAKDAHKGAILILPAQYFSGKTYQRLLCMTIAPLLTSLKETCIKEGLL